jgi:O-antigen/teichoic acid export membrane protein
MTEGLEHRAAADSLGLRRRLLLGFGAQGLTFVAVTAQQLLLVPLFLGRWGAELYGNWLVLLAAADVLRLLEFGLHFHMANRIRMAWARGDRQQFDRMLCVGMGVYAGLLGTAALLLLVAIPRVDWSALLGVTAMSSSSVAWTLALLASATLLMLPRNLIVAIYAAHGEFSRGEALGALFILVQTAGTGAALVMGATPAEIAGVYVAATVLVGLGAVILDQAHRYPTIACRLALPTPAEARDLAEKARHYSLPVLSEIVLTRAPIIILALLAPVSAAVVVFSVSRTFTGVVRQIAAQIANASGIEMSRQYAQQDAAGRRRLYLRTGRLIGGVVGLLTGLSVAVAEPFIRFWCHGTVAFDPWVVGAFLLAIFLAAPAQAGMSGLQYISQPRPLARAALLQIVASLGLCVLLVPLAGAAGAAVAMGMSEAAVLGVYISIVASREVEVAASSFLVQAYGLGAAIAAITYACTLIVGGVVEVRGVVDLGIFFAASLALSVIPTFFLLLSRDQRRWLLNGLGRSGPDRPTHQRL